MLIDLRVRGKRLPTRVGFYAAMDELRRDIKAKILSHTPFPEYEFGMRSIAPNGEMGKRKMILQGNKAQRDNPMKTNNPRSNSQLKNIIRYLRASIDDEEED